MLFTLFFSEFLGAITPSFAIDESFGVVASIPLEGSPGALAVDPSNGYVYVATTVANYFGANNVSIIEPQTNQVIENITVGSDPSGFAFDSLDDLLFVTNYLSDTVSVINTSTNTVVDNVSVGLNPEGIAFDLSNNCVYVANSGGPNLFRNNLDNVSVIDATRHKVIATITVGTHPTSVLFDPFENEIYVTNYNSNTISVINGSTNIVASTLPAGANPDSMTLNSRDKSIYVANVAAVGPSSAYISVINASTNNAVGKITATNDSILDLAFDTSTGYLYGAGAAYGYVWVLDVVTNSVIATIKSNPSIFLAFDPLNGYVYLSSANSNAVFVLSSTIGQTTSSSTNVTSVVSNSSGYTSSITSSSREQSLSTVTYSVSPSITSPQNNGDGFQDYEIAAAIIGAALVASGAFVISWKRRH